MRWLDRLLGKQRATPKHEAADEARRQAGEQSVRPDIQAGALRMAGGEQPRKHEHPSYREAAEEREEQ